jgi:hypothetical protein
LSFSGHQNWFDLAMPSAAIEIAGTSAVMLTAKAANKGIDFFSIGNALQSLANKIRQVRISLAMPIGPLE